MIYGVGTHIVASNLERGRSALKDLGAQSIREDILWDASELTLGVFALNASHLAKLAAMESAGVENVLILAYGNNAHGIGQPYTSAERAKFLDYVRWVVPLTRHCVKYYEIWNEWNHGAGASAAQVTSGLHGGTQQYADLCRDAYPIIKSLAPNSIVLTGSTSKVWSGHWYPALCDAGILPFTDGFSVHAYTHSEATPNHLPPRAITYLNDIDTLVKAKNGGVSVPQYITEMGWPTHTTGHAASAVGHYLSWFYRLADQLPFVRGVWWYDLWDDGSVATDREHRFGLMANDAITPKPAYHAFKGLTNRTRIDQYGWCRVAVTAAVQTQINGGTLPDRVKRGLKDLRSANATVAVGARTLNVMSGPVDLAALDAIGERLGDDLVIIEGPVVRGQVPAQTTATRTNTWPNGWS